MTLFRQLLAASVVMLLTTVPVLAETGADFLAKNAKKPGNPKMNTTTLFTTDEYSQTIGVFSQI